MIIYDKEKMNDLSLVGGKGFGLYKLLKYGYDVPDFFVITVGTKLNDKNFAAELDSFAAILHCEIFSVRSSNVNEDSVENSFAGQYSTELNVKREELLKAVKRVALSCKNQSVNSYANRFETTVSEMAVIVQRQINGEKSGVMFTSSPLSSGETVIESVRGMGESLVSGHITPTRKTIAKNSYAKDSIDGILLSAARNLEMVEGRSLDIEWTCSDGKVWFLQMRPLTAIGDALPEIAQRDWRFYVYRDFCLFSHGIQRIASTVDVQQKTFGFSVPISEGLIVNGREFYSPQSDALEYEIWKNIDKAGFFEQFIKDIKKCVVATKRYTATLKHSDFKSLSIDGLFSVYRREIYRYIKSYVPLMMRPDEYLHRKLIEAVGEKEAKDIISAVSFVNKKTFYSAEKTQFLKAVICGDTQSYLNEYEWINNPLGEKLHPVTADDFQKRAEGLTFKEAQSKLKKSERLHKNSVGQKKRVLSSIDNEEVLRLTCLIGEFIYLRTYTAENSDRYFYYIRKNILNLLAERLQISEDVVMLMSPEEVLNTQNGFRLTLHEVIKRRSGEVVVISDGESKSYYTNASYSLLKRLMPSQEFVAGTVLTGEPACMGEVCGRVKIVSGFVQAANFEEGDIIVTTMTTPELTVALDKASGIITDEGGITCHAAIIAREYAIPCLVGTKNATSVLKDGMTVELDCINGTVKILKEI